MATTETTVISTNTFIVTPAISDNVKDAWNKLISDLRGSGVINEAVADIREGVNEMTADLKSDIQSTIGTIEDGLHSVFAGFVESSSTGMNGLEKTVYTRIMNNAENSLKTAANEAMSDFWKETDDFCKSLNIILDSAMKDSKLDINKLATQVFDAVKTEFSDLVNDFQTDLNTQYQSALLNLGLAAGAAGLVVTQEQWTQFENNIVSTVSLDIAVGAAKTGVDLTAEFFEMAGDLTSTINKNKDSLLKIAVVDGLNLVQATAKSIWKAIKKWF